MRTISVVKDEVAIAGFLDSIRRPDSEEFDKQPTHPDDKGVFVDQRNYYGRTALMEAARRREACISSTQHRIIAFVSINAPSKYLNAAYSVNWTLYEKQYFPHDLPVADLTRRLYAFANFDPDTDVYDLFVFIFIYQPRAN
ncbi:hypothetical protein EYC80_000850 [Monilinia laxa]|uniref:GH18 domain-containing protein n=1 Tax=Monilinia laxa TaxID=61186 RepID=A0A5N6K797_MONLA|nr:hypothetical protein EYC80_000850 [Monilinia laxa]